MMSWFDFAAGTSAPSAMGWTLLHSLWQGSVIASLLAGILGATRSPRIRYVAACGALAAMLLCFLITLVHFWPAVGEGGQIRIGINLPLWREAAVLHPNDGVFLNFAALVPWLAPLWLAGVCFFYLRCAAGWLSLGRLRARGTFAPPALWQRTLANLAREMKISRPVTLLESVLTDMPVVLGHVRPVILVPVGFLTGLPPEYVEAILLHELAHIGRADHVINICQRIAEGVLFYHPATWWMSWVIRAERENCCDDEVVGLRSNAHGYALALAALEENRCQQNWPAQQAAMAATGGNLMKRITRLLYPARPTGIWAPILAALVLLAGSAAAFAAWQAEPSSSLAPAHSDSQVQSQWQKWLNEDVVYIISDEETAAFERLKTDAERQMFVDQFWARRDPAASNSNGTFSSVTLTPAAEKLKQEHYRRIAYANQHFRTASGTPGWRTDRGHMYIVYGPPDEIDSHPKTAGADGIESWRYRYIEGLGANRFFTLH